MVYYKTKKNRREEERPLLIVLLGVDSHQVLTYNKPLQWVLKANHAFVFWVTTPHRRGFFSLIFAHYHMYSRILGESDGDRKFFWEFDPGSGWTLAACLKHASRTERYFVARQIVDQWRTGEYKQGTYPKLLDSSSKDGVIRYVDASLKSQDGFGAALFPSACW